MHGHAVLVEVSSRLPPHRSQGSNSSGLLGLVASIHLLSRLPTSCVNFMCIYCMHMHTHELVLVFQNKVSL